MIRRLVRSSAFLSEISDARGFCSHQRCLNTFTPATSNSQTLFARFNDILSRGYEGRNMRPGSKHRNLQNPVINNFNHFSNTANTDVSANSKTNSDVTEDDTTPDETDDDPYQYLDADEHKRLQVLQIEYDVWSAEGARVAQRMTSQMWLELLRECPTPQERTRRHHFYCTRERAEAKWLARRQERMAAHELRVRAAAERLAAGGPLPNTFLLVLHDLTMNRHYYWNLAYAMQHGAPLVFDCSYAAEQHPRAQREVAKQVLLSYAANKVAAEPFHLHLCGVAPDTVLRQRLDEPIGSARSGLFNSVPCTYTEQHYLELFPRDRIVILSPNAEQVLEEWDSNVVYVVGGIVDVGRHLPLTMARAKREKVRAMRLPLDKHLSWGLGTKALTLDQMTKILLDLKDTHDWSVALKHVPMRKLKSNINQPNVYKNKPWKHKRVTPEFL